MNRQIKTTSSLKYHCNNGKTDFFIVLNGGLRSSKYITYNDGIYYVRHLIDDSEEQLTRSKLLKTNIGEAIMKGAFYVE